MMAVHILPPIDDDGDVSVAFVVAAGRSSALFAVLAGVGLALLTRWDGQTSPRRRAYDRVAITTRALLLVAIGLALGVPDSGVAVILVSYGVLFVLALPFLGLSPRALMTWAAGTALVAPVVSHVVRPALAAPSYEVPTLEFFDRSWVDAAGELLLTGYYPAIPWMAYIFAGLAIGRLDLRDRVTAWRLLGTGSLLAVGAWATSRLLLQGLSGIDILRLQAPSLFGRPLDQALDIGLFGTTPTGSPWWLAVGSAHTATPLDLAATIGSAMAALGLCLLLVPHRRWWAAPFIAVGGMSLTVYTVHVLLLDGVLPRTMEHAYLWHVLVLTTGALVWRRLVGQGPLEWVTQKVARTVARLVVGTPSSTPPPETPAVLP